MQQLCNGVAMSLMENQLDMYNGSGDRRLEVRILWLLGHDLSFVNLT
jgi:hypothetical protein